MALANVDGVEAASVSYKTGEAVVTYDPGRTSPDRFIAELTRLTGYTAVVASGAPDPMKSDAPR